MEKETLWLSSEAYLSLAADAKRRGFQVLEQYFTARAHQATVQVERAKVEALGIIEAARVDAGAAYESTKDEMDREAARLVCIESPDWLAGAVAGLPRCA